MEFIKYLKQIAICLGFILIFINKSVAQEMFLNDSREKTQQLFLKNEIKKTRIGKTDNRIYEYDQYEVGKDTFLSFYYKNNSICSFITNLFMNKSDLIAAIQDLNNRFERVDSTHWITKDKITQIELQISDKYFSVVYQKI